MITPDDDVERRWLESRAEDVEDAPQLLGIFVAVAAVLSYFRPPGWQFCWMFFLLGTVTGIARILAIRTRARGWYRAVSLVGDGGMVVMVLILFYRAQTSLLAAALFGFATAIPPKLLLVICRRSLMESIGLVREDEEEEP